MIECGRCCARAVAGAPRRLPSPAPRELDQEPVVHAQTSGAHVLQHTPRVEESSSIFTVGRGNIMLKARLITPFLVSECLRRDEILVTVI